MRGDKSSFVVARTMPERDPQSARPRLLPPPRRRRFLTGYALFCSLVRFFFLPPPSFSLYFASRRNAFGPKLDVLPAATTEITVDVMIDGFIRIDYLTSRCKISNEAKRNFKRTRFTRTGKITLER